MLETIRINNVKVIRSSEGPLILKNLSEINYLLGKNGSGKTAILDALQSIYALTNLTSGSKDKHLKQFSVTPTCYESTKSYFITFLNSPLIKLYNEDYYIELEFKDSIYIYSHITQMGNLIPEKFIYKNECFEELLFYAPLIERGSVQFSGINDQIEEYKNQDSYEELVRKINFILKEFGLEDSIVLINEVYVFQNTQEKVSFSLLSTGIKHFYELLQFVESQVKLVINTNLELDSRIFVQ